jgi:hypothetical protein
VSLLAAVAIFGTPTPAHAACGQQTDPADAMQLADSVFVGRVVALENLTRQATMEVVEVWKGPKLTDRVAVQGASSDSPIVGQNDRTYVLGATYLVVPFGRSSPFYDDACSATSLFTPQGGRIPVQYRDAVGASAAWIPAIGDAGEPAPEPQGGVSLPVVLGGGAAVLAALWLVARGRKKTPRAAQVAGAEAIGPPTPPPLEDPPVSQAPAVGETNGSSLEVERSPDKSQAKKRDSKPKRVKSSRSRRVASARAPAKTPRFGKSGLSNLETVRKKSRRIKEKQQKARAK